jgi:hypothetical protein
VAGGERGYPAARHGVDAGQDLVCASKKAIGWHQAVDSHVGAPMVVIVDPRGQAALGLGSVLEVEALPQLTLERADGALDLPPPRGL